MLKSLTLAGAAVLAVAGAAQAQEHGPVKLEGIDWRTDLEGARAEAKQAGKPLLVTFR